MQNHHFFIVLFPYLNTFIHLMYYNIDTVSIQHGYILNLKVYIGV